MRTIALLLAAMLLAGAAPKTKPKPRPKASPAATESAASAKARAELDARIAKVRAAVAAQEKSLPATRAEKSLRGCGAKSGTLTAWLDGKRVVKIEARLFRDDGEMVRLFWFDADGKLLYSKIERPQSAPPEEGAEPATPTEYFFEKGQVFRWTSGPNAPPPEEVTGTADELLRGVKSDDTEAEC